jgi:hypothetical protein
VTFARLSGNYEKLADACPLLPRLDKFVHDPVKRAAAQGGSSGEGACRLVNAILDRRDARYAERFREVVCQPLDNDGIAAERKMRPVLLGRAYGYDQRGTLP